MKEGRERRRLKPKIFIYPKKKKQTKMERRQRGTFLSRTRDVDTAPLHAFSLKESKPMTL